MPVDPNGAHLSNQEIWDEFTSKPLLRKLIPAVTTAQDLDEEFRIIIQEAVHLRLVRVTVQQFL